MEQARVIPSDVAFLGFLNACSHAGLLREGRGFFNKILSHGPQPRIKHYGCMVNMLGRAGLLEEAQELVKNMPIKPDDVIYLLSACRTHSNSKLGAWAAERLLRLAPVDGDCYVLLSNFYASLGQ
ncbi:hypothetical protein HPP92_027602 [Vanilla planifolia]|uniref:Pentatricopeptide repeat-containing protein n=1 Tax=Vanilla planifolia TaxID=51239 RepID=A0A835PB52_VANPL|nr:hypothetical protein HPP92_027602 [Vanilla planifolia]KAG0448957.1 hypothetical protein HPP92_027599 [Vanilla planifolia]